MKYILLFKHLLFITNAILFITLFSSKSSYSQVKNPSNSVFKTLDTLPTLDSSEKKFMDDENLLWEQENNFPLLHKDSEKAISVNSLLLSPGDQVRIVVQEGEIFSGVYEVNLDGTVQIPYMKPIYIAGLTLVQAQQVIKEQLIEQKIFKVNYAKASVSIVQWSAIEVNVAGEVFRPGPVSINIRSPEERALIRDRVSGDYAPSRSLSASLITAGGVTPLANVKEIQVIRGNQTYTVDISGIFTGEPFEDIPLISGDRIFVPSTGVWQNNLVTPSAITLPAVQIRISNLTVPAQNNSSASLNREAITFPYGSRLSHAVISGNCVGGTQAINAGRYVILVRTDPLTGTINYYENSVQELIREADDETNPFLMPDDGIACYDSIATNVRDTAGIISDVLSPINIIKTIFGW